MERAPGASPGYGAAPRATAARPQGYGGPAPAYSGRPDAGSGQRPGMVTAAGIIGIVWGALGLLFGLLGAPVAFACRRRLRACCLLVVGRCPAPCSWAASR